MQTNPAVEQNKNPWNQSGRKGKGLWRKWFAEEPSLKFRVKDWTSKRRCKWWSWRWWRRTAICVIGEYNSCDRRKMRVVSRQELMTERRDQNNSPFCQPITTFKHLNEPTELQPQVLKNCGWNGIKANCSVALFGHCWKFIHFFGILVTCNNKMLIFSKLNNRSIKS